MALSSNADEAAEGAQREQDDDRGEGHPATMKQNLMTRRRVETASGDLNTGLAGMDIFLVAKISLSKQQ